MDKSQNHNFVLYPITFFLVYILLASVMIHSDAKRGLDIPSSLTGLWHLLGYQKVCDSSSVIYDPWHCLPFRSIHLRANIYSLPNSAQTFFIVCIDSLMSYICKIYSLTSTRFSSRSWLKVASWGLILLARSTSSSMVALSFSTLECNV
jgi:hypothetical protein